VRINGQLYEVIGVFEHDTGMFVGPGVDAFAVIPLSSFRKHYPEAKELILAFTVPEGVKVETAQDEVVQAMRRLRHVPPDKENDFEISSPDFLSNLWNQLTGALVILTGVISSIGLVVGGIGVMNIMLISVTERTHEIGLRKAIGARRADIRLQFLLEAVALTLSGGNDWNSDRGCSVDAGTHFRAVHPRQLVVSLGSDWLHDLGKRWTLFWLLSCQSRRQFGPDCVPPL
jgi:putative ABC transport system permease protein